MVVSISAIRASSFITSGLKLTNNFFVFFSKAGSAPVGHRLAALRGQKRDVDGIRLAMTSVRDPI